MIKSIKSFVSVIKMSFSTKTHNVKTDFGIIRLCGYRYAYGKLVKMYSVSGSKTMHNGGGYTLRGLKVRMFK